jgi:predicted RNase H-like HicB family nuclease
MTKKVFTYTVVYESDSETGYFCASVPALDLATHGRTMEEAQAMIREALELHLEGMLDENMPIPPDVLKSELVTVEVSPSVSPGAPA